MGELATGEQHGCDCILFRVRVYFVLCCERGNVMVVYLDGVIGLNFLVDWCLLLGVNRLAGYRGGYGRTAAGAALGGGYAGMCVIPSFSFLTSDLWRIVSLGLMSAAAFGLNKGAVRRGILFVLLSFSLGGLVMSADLGDFSGLVFCGGLLTGLCHFGFQNKGVSRRIIDVSLEFRGRKVSLQALVDTGNGLRDPITGQPVLVTDGLCAWELAGLSRKQLLEPAQTMAQIRDLPLRLIPYRTVGKEGMLLALRCDRVEIGNEEGGRIVAFSPEGFVDGEFRALTGGQYG